MNASLKTSCALLFAATAVANPSGAMAAAQPTWTATAEYKAQSARAEQAATGLAKNLVGMCRLPSPEPAGADRGPSPSVPFKPGQAFDNLYYVGLKGVSSWAVKTSDGIILIDALNDTKDAQESLIPSLRAVGLDPNQIKYVILTHGHGDHMGGALYLQQQFKAHVIASAADWDVMYAPSLFPPNTLRGERPPPKRDIVKGEGDTLTLGDTTITFHLTPGHTPGTLSMLIPVKDKGAPHTAVMWGGVGFNFPPTPAAFKIYADSAKRMGEIAAARGADVILANHPGNDNTPQNLPMLAERKPGQANPYVVGPAVVKSYFTVLNACASAKSAAL